MELHTALLLLSVTSVYSGIQVNVIVWSLVVYLLGRKVGSWCWNLCWIRTAKKGLNLWSNSIGDFLFVVNPDEITSTQNILNVWSCSTGWALVCILIFWVLLVVLLISYPVLLLFMGFCALSLKCCTWAVARDAHEWREQIQSEVLQVSVLCAELHT